MGKRMLFTPFKLIKLHLQPNLADINTLSLLVKNSHRNWSKEHSGLFFGGFWFFFIVSFIISFLNKLENKNKTHLETL